VLEKHNLFCGQRFQFDAIDVPTCLQGGLALKSKRNQPVDRRIQSTLGNVLTCLQGSAKLRLERLQAVNRGFGLILSMYPPACGKL
jgi:hypothetical protein